GLRELLTRAAAREEGATVFAYHVRDPERYGVVTFDEAGRPLRIEEKPRKPTSNWAITGLYFFDNRVVRYARRVKPPPKKILSPSTIATRSVPMKSAPTMKASARPPG
ncbi:sugar phosphate nucleotidyltransferase, partial [Bradyrhizobium ottawaense]|uniref:sugar phosphate nucleotidyltransferase n=1 Tax=Bradyrhizobium ottawaense TaxID=931866 RepID=UPI003BA27C78